MRGHVHPLHGDIHQLGRLQRVVVGEHVAPLHVFERHPRQVHGEPRRPLGHVDRHVVHLQRARVRLPSPPFPHDEQRRSRLDAPPDQRPGHHRPRAAHREDAVDGHPRAPPFRPLGRTVERPSHRGAQRLEPLSRLRRAADDLRAPALPEERARLVSGKLRQLRVNRVDLRYGDDRAAHPEELAHRDVLPRLGHHPFVGRDHQDHELHPAGPRDHRVDEPPMPRHVDEARVDSAAEVPRREPELDRDSAPLLLGETVGVAPRERADEARLAVVDVTGGAEDEAAHRGG